MASNAMSEKVYRDILQVLLPRDLQAEGPRMTTLQRLKSDSTPTRRIRLQNDMFSVISNDSQQKEKLDSTFERALAMSLCGRDAF